MDESADGAGNSDPVADGPHVAPASLAERVLRGERTTVLDVRDRDEFERWHIDGPAVDIAQVPHVRFVAANARGDPAAPLDGTALDPESRIVTVCAVGEASAEVAALLRGAGYDAATLSGGMEAWARSYQSWPIEGVEDSTATGSSDVDLRQYHRPSSGCLSYLIAADGEAAVVDPLRAFAERYEADAGELGATLRYAIDTHVHADHLSCMRAVCRRSGATPVVPGAVVDREFDLDALEAATGTTVRTVADGTVLAVGGAELEAITLPGHTTEMTGFTTAGVVFAGDSLFLDAVARPDLEAGADAAPAYADQLYDTIHDRIGSLPAETTLAPGHVGPTTPARDGQFTAPLQDVMALPILALDRAAFVERVAGTVPPQPANSDRIVAINCGLESAPDDEVLELEYGPNNCAAG